MKVKIIEFPMHLDPTGNLYVADENDLPFEPKRAFWIDDISGRRGNHAHKECQHIVVAARGSFNIQTQQKSSHHQTWRLQDPKHGLFVPEWTWEALFNFSKNALCLVLASHPYDPLDYIEDFNEFLEGIFE